MLMAGGVDRAACGSGDEVMADWPGRVSPCRVFAWPSAAATSHAMACRWKMATLAGLLSTGFTTWMRGGRVGRLLEDGIA